MSKPLSPVEQFNKRAIREVMKEPLPILETSTIEIASAKLSASPSEMVEVVDNQGKLVGVATKTSIMKAMLERGSQKNEKITTKATYTQPLTIKDTQIVAEAIFLMNTNRVDKLPVVNDNGVLVGTISRKDLLDEVGSYLRFSL